MQQQSVVPKIKKPRGLATQHSYQMFLFGGIASCSAAVATCPMEVVKVRMQLQGERGTKRLYRHSLHCAVKVFRNEGWRALFKGLSPACLRMATYGTMRFGFYGQLRNLLGGDDGALWRKVFCGIGAGALASAVCNPTDLIKVRMQACKGTSKLSGRFRYNSLAEAVRDIVKREGLRGMYKGVGPTTFRGAVVAGAELSTYDHLKKWLMQHGFREESTTFITVSFIAGFISSFVSNPVDVVKSRMMNQAVDKNGNGKMYRNAFHCAWKLVRKEGVIALWKGFVPSFVRNGPNVIVTFWVVEQLVRISEWINN